MIGRTLAANAAASFAWTRRPRAAASAALFRLPRRAPCAFRAANAERVRTEISRRSFWASAAFWDARRQRCVERQHDPSVPSQGNARSPAFDPSFLFENEITHSFYQLMFDFIPAEVAAQFGEYEASMMPGESLVLDGKREFEIVAALRARGFIVERNQTLIDALFA